MSDVTQASGATLLYQIDPRLNSELPRQPAKNDGYYGLPEDVTMLQCLIAYHAKERFVNKYTRQLILPRLLWVNRRMSLKELHVEVFRHMRAIIADWCEWTEPNTTRVPKKDAFDCRQLPDFPYRLPGSEEQMTRAQFDALSDEEAYNLLFTGVTGLECNDQR